MKTKIWMIVTLFLMGGIGCTKDPIDNLTNEESRIYITNKDAAINFATFANFNIADSVTVIDGNQVGVQLNNTDQAFISAFSTEMKNRGFAEVPKTGQPELGVRISRIIRTSTGVVTFNDFYGGWNDPFYWGFPGYGWGIPTWGYATYQVQEGMLSIDMVDLKNAAANNQLKVVWNGLIRGSGIFNANTAASQVAALFNQSPYLRK